MIDIMSKVNDLREALVDGYRVSLDTPEDYEVSICQVKDGYNIVTNLKNEYVPHDPNGIVLYAFTGASPSEIDAWAENHDWDYSVVLGDSVEQDIKDAMVEEFDDDEADDLKDWIIRTKEEHDA